MSANAAVLERKKTTHGLRPIHLPLSVLTGGIATIFVVLLMWAKVPALRNYREQAAPAQV
jgi:hypothetical protein